MPAERVFIFNIDRKNLSVLLAELEDLLNLVSHVVERQELIFGDFTRSNEHEHSLFLQVIEDICAGKAFITGSFDEFLFLLMPHDHVLAKISICGFVLLLADPAGNALDIHKPVVVKNRVLFGFKVRQVVFNRPLVYLKIAFQPCHEGYTGIDEGIGIDVGIVSCIQDGKLCVDPICFELGNRAGDGADIDYVACHIPEEQWHTRALLDYIDQADFLTDHSVMVVDRSERKVYSVRETRTINQYSVVNTFRSRA